jgi:hypothetical protein
VKEIRVWRTRIKDAQDERGTVPCSAHAGSGRARRDQRSALSSASNCLGCSCTLPSGPGNVGGKRLAPEVAIRVGRRRSLFAGEELREPDSRIRLYTDARRCLTIAAVIEVGAFLAYGLIGPRRWQILSLDKIAQGPCRAVETPVPGRGRVELAIRHGFSPSVCRRGCRPHSTDRAGFPQRYLLDSG